MTGKKGSSHTAIVAILVIAVLILLGWFFFFRDGRRSDRTFFERRSGPSVNIEVDRGYRRP